ncbi:bacteriochlorophyll synthase 44.5 kDa chain [alpha proteobacterium Q-1]|nr:bacteriochlorophyll synthase 44.5 kDa chain [alpha proteobacterium Q-1]
MSKMGRTMSWPGIIRLGLVQAALGAIVVLTTSTINRVMVVELGLLAILPGFLVGLHYAIQISRPRMGYGADAGRRCTPWIIGGMAVLALGGVMAALSVALMAQYLVPGIILAVLAFVMIGLGVGASGTTLLTLMAKQVAPARRAGAATLVWVMMIMGFILTATIAGAFLEPFSLLRLIIVTSIVSGLAFGLAVLAIMGLEKTPDHEAMAVADHSQNQSSAQTSFRAALIEIWGEPKARLFTLFVFLSMLAYSAQDLILEPFAGMIFGYSPGQSTQLAGLQHSGVLLGMALVGVAGSFAVIRRWLPTSVFMMAGCVLSALALLGLVMAAMIGSDWPLVPTVFFLGFANGLFAVAAIGTMMALASEGRAEREGTRMGLWGAAQAIAFGLGGFIGTAGVDLMRFFFADPALSYAVVFAAEAFLFLLAAGLALRVKGMMAAKGAGESVSRPSPAMPAKAPSVPLFSMEGS